MSANAMFSLAELEAAAHLVHRTLPPTPQYAWPLLAKRTGCEVCVKHENHTLTCAFKVRGGIVYMENLQRSRAKVAGVITATRGNHGQSIAFSASRAGIPATIYVPRHNSTDQNTAMRIWGDRRRVRQRFRRGARRMPSGRRRAGSPFHLAV